MFPFSQDGSFLFTGSLKPPVLLQPAAAAATSSGSLACWAILDAAAYIADRKNGTYAETTTRTGQVLGVSFWLADPPAVSHLCVHCPGMNVAKFLDEPLVVCSGKDVAVIRVAYAFGARPIESTDDWGITDLDYLVYRAGHATRTRRSSCSQTQSRSSSNPKSVTENGLCVTFSSPTRWMATWASV